MRQACVILAALLALAVPVAGQVGARPPDEGPADLGPGEIQRLFDAMLIADAQQALDLSDKQFPDFLTRLRTLQETRRRNLMQRVRLMAELRRLSNPRNQQVDEPALKTLLNALQELEARSAAELRRAYDAMDDVLNPRQQARFRVLEEQLERRKIELLMRARQNRLQPRRQQQLR